MPPFYTLPCEPKRLTICNIKYKLIQIQSGGWVAWKSPLPVGVLRDSEFCCQFSPMLLAMFLSPKTCSVCVWVCVCECAPACVHMFVCATQKGTDWIHVIVSHQLRFGLQKSKIAGVQVFSGCNFLL